MRGREDGARQGGERDAGRRPGPVRGGAETVSARDDVLDRVRAALTSGGVGGRVAPSGSATAPATAGAVGTASPAPAEGPSAARADDADLAGRLCERLRDLGVEVVRVELGGVGEEIERVCRRLAATRFVVPPALPAVWRPRSVEVVEDRHLSAEALAGFDGAIVGCTLAIAETGTVVLTAGPAEGRRALSLVPDLLVCVVGEGEVVADLPAALPVLAPLVREQLRPLVFISGPSATSDIELDRVQGVHGPRRLVMLVVSG